MGVTNPPKSDEVEASEGEKAAPFHITTEVRLLRLPGARGQMRLWSQADYTDRTLDVSQRNGHVIDTATLAATHPLTGGVVVAAVRGSHQLAVVGDRMAVAVRPGACPNSETAFTPRESV